MKNYKGLVVVVQQLQPMLQVAKEQTVDLLVQRVEAAVAVGSSSAAKYFFAAVLAVVLPFDVGWNCKSFVKDHNAAYAC